MSAEDRTPSYNDTPWYVHDCTVTVDKNARRVVLFLLYLLIFMAGLVGNLLVLWVNWRRRQSSNGVLFCILNVCLSDMMVIIVMPFFMMEVTIEYVWLWGSFLCKVTKLIHAVNFYSSSFFLALMTLERYLSLTKPAFPALFPTVGRRRWWLCAGVWLLSLFLALLENVHIKLTEWNEPGCFMLPEQSHLEWNISIVVLHFIFQFLVPSAVIITCNVLIARAVRAAPDVQNPRDIRLVHVYSLVFVLCWLPYHVVTVVSTIDIVLDFIHSCNVMTVLHFTYEIMLVLSFVHCVANPILYNLLTKSFRRNLINMMVTYINKEGNAAQLEAGARPNGGDASTSQSDVGS